MRILAFDTTGEWGGAGIFRDAECLASITHDGPANYSVWLFQAVDRLLDQTRLELREIDLFAAANGPGSFTGIRVGLAAAQGWAHALGKPLQGVSVLEAMVEEARPHSDYAISVLDARRGEFYAGFFRRAQEVESCRRGNTDPVAGCKFMPSDEGFILKPDRLSYCVREALSQGASLTGITRHNDAAARALLASQPFGWQPVTPFLIPAIARLAYRAHQEGRQPAVQAPYYIRRADAELNWKD